MNKGQQFWLDLWQEGRTSFHKKEVNPDLLAYWSHLHSEQWSTVLVPLCGKSLDILWLYQQGFHVIGIELSEQAVLQFAHENRVPLQLNTVGTFKHYFTAGIDFWVADIFELEYSLIPLVDAIYDRGALIALPQRLRSNYTQRCLDWLKPQGGILLKTMCYDQEVMEGPPYSVSDEEIYELYQSCAVIQCVKKVITEAGQEEHLYERGLRTATHSVWCMKKE